MKIVFNVTGLIVGGVLLVIAGILFLVNIIYIYIREWWYDNKRCPHCSKRHDCFRNYLNPCTKGFKKESK